MSNVVYDIQGYQPENIALGDEVEYTVQKKIKTMKKNPSV